MSKVSKTTESNCANMVLAAGLCKYMVGFRVIRPEYAFTPLMFLPIERIMVEYKSGLVDGYMLCVPISKELDINPDYIRIEDFQPCS